MKNIKTNGLDKNVVLACSGASDVGHMTDLIARKMRDKGHRKMSCLALIGAGIKDSIEDLKKKNIMVIDGCSTDCGKAMLDKNGFKDYEHFRITDLGFNKGETKVNKENVQLLCDAIC